MLDHGTYRAHAHESIRPPLCLCWACEGLCTPCAATARLTLCRVAPRDSTLAILWPLAYPNAAVANSVSQPAPESRHPWLISLLPPSTAHKRAAVAVATFFVVLFLVCFRFANIGLAEISVYIPLVAAIMFLNDVITASLLLAQFSVVRSRALLWLGNGYLFTALVVAAYGLFWPGAFHSSGPFGAGPQTEPWLYLIWHAGLPVAIIIYGFLRRREREVPSVARDSVLRSIATSTVCTTFLALALTWFFAQFREALPVLMTPLNQASDFSRLGTSAVLLACTTAFVVEWRNRQRSVLDLWLSVVALAWLLGSGMLVAVGVRYDVAWYAAPGFSVVSATLVLLVLLSESLTLHAQLAISLSAQQRERERRRLSMEVMSIGIAHEFRQPLGAIVASADAAMRWLARTPADVGKAQDSLKRIANDARRAESVIQSVRAIFSDVTTGRGALPRNPVDLNGLIRDAIAIMRAELDSAKITVELDLTKEPPPFILADGGQLQHVLLNLIANAADAMRTTGDGPRVLTVTSKGVEAKSVTILVEDTGTGIDSENVDRIFDAFFTTKSNGMGLGLAICQSIVESYGGTVTAEPKGTRGSILRITLPLEGNSP